MPGLGKSDYPELTASKAFEIVEKVGRESVKTANGLATVMGLKSPDSGYFYHQVSSLTKYYGLIDRTKGTIALTSLGERIAHPLSEADKSHARAEAVRRVGLLSALFERLGTGFHEADFKTTLRDVTQAPLADIERASTDVERLYKDAQRYLSQGGPSKPGSVAEPWKSDPQAGDHGERSASSSSATFAAHEQGYRTFQADGVYLKIKRDRESLEEALATIQGWLKRHSSDQGRSQSTE